MQAGGHDSARGGSPGSGGGAAKAGTGWRRLLLWGVLLMERGGERLVGARRGAWTRGVKVVVSAHVPALFCPSTLRVPLKARGPLASLGLALPLVTSSAVFVRCADGDAHSRDPVARLPGQRGAAGDE